MSGFPAETLPQPAGKTTFVTKATPTPAPGSLRHGDSDLELVKQRAVTDLAVGSVPGFKYIGCHADNIGTPILHAVSAVWFNYNNPAVCCQWCINQYSRFSVCGVEASTNCLCGFEVVETGIVADSECNRLCPGLGTSSVACGASYRMNMYSATIGLSNQVTVGSGSPTTMSVDGYTHLGCYSDHDPTVSTRLFQQQAITEMKFMSPEYCCGLCRNFDPDYVLCAVEVQNECYCGKKDAIAVGTSGPGTLYSNTCLGNINQLCGGSFMLRVYSATGTANSQPPDPATQTSGRTSSGGTGNTEPATPGKSGLHGGTIAGVVIGALAGIALIAGVIFFLWRRHGKQRDEKLARARAAAIEVPGDNQFGGPGPYQLETNLSPEGIKSQSQVFHEMPAHPGPEQYQFHQHQQPGQQPLELPLEQPAQEQLQQPYQQRAQQPEHQPEQRPEQQLPQQLLQQPPQQPPQ